MRYAIIAAGEGSRLSQEGVMPPKPLVPLCGTPLIERLIRIFSHNGADNISIIINSRQPDTLTLLQQLQKEFPLNIVVKDTPSSMHSLHALSPYLRGDRFCLTTVDTIFSEKEFSTYIENFKNSTSDGLMAVTDYIDDEKPLYIETDDEMNIKSFLDTPPDSVKYVSGGIYALSEKALDTLEKCINAGQSRMRNFQRALITDELSIKAYAFGKIIDIDHADDITKAESFLCEI